MAVLGDISAITLPTGNTYKIKDFKARQDIGTLSTGLSTLSGTVNTLSGRIDTISGLIQGGVHYIGKTTTELSDGSTVNPITIDSKSVTAEQGDMASYTKAGAPQDLEFIFNGNKWYELGSTGSLKAFAFADTGTVTVPELTGISVGIELSSAVLTSTGSFTPQGTIGLSAKSTTNAVAVSNPGSGETATYKPTGTISGLTIGITTAGLTASVNNATAKTVVVSATQGSLPTCTMPTYTEPQCTMPTCTMPTCTLPTFSSTVSDEVLSFGWSAGSYTNGSYSNGSYTGGTWTDGTFSPGALPTFSSGNSIDTTPVTVKTGDPTISVTQQPVFDGDGKMFKYTDTTVSAASFSGDGGTVTVTGTPSTGIKTAGAVPQTQQTSYTVNPTT